MGTDTVFGIPGNHTVELYRGLARYGMRHVTARHEQGAAFMADGYARASGKPGVCILVSGPGLLNAATAIAQARADSVPMLVITGVGNTKDLGMQRGALHELPDQHATAASFCRSSHTLLNPDNLARVIQRAFTCFECARPGPVHIEIPLDVMAQSVDKDLQDDATEPTSLPLPAPPGPAPDAIEAACERLARARSPLLLLGGGAIGAAPQLVSLAETLDAPVLNTVNGKGIVAADHPLAVGGSPSLPSLQTALAASDAVLAVGTEFSETDYDLLMTGAVELDECLIRLDVDALQIGNNASPAIGITCDAALGAQALLAAFEKQTHARPDGRQGIKQGSQRAAELRRSIQNEPHFNPEMRAFLNALGAAAPDAIVLGDSTRPTYYAAWQYECSRPRSYFHSVSGFGTLGWSLPAALGAALATDRPVIGLIGDGGAQFTLPELGTGAQERLGVPILVWNHQGYQEIENSMNRRGVLADSTHLQPPDFQAGAKAHGCLYAHPAEPAALTASIKAAHGAEVPTIIEVSQDDFATQPSGQWYT
jgi:acetolactate synthase-1/2/3 large subunit